MRQLLCAKRIQRALAAWIGAAYCCLSLLVPFHHHSHNEICSPASNIVTAGALNTGQDRIAVSALDPKCNHCAACEWEAAITAPAMPALILHYGPPIAPQVHAYSPLTLRAYSTHTSSRGPPLV